MTPLIRVLVDRMLAVTPDMPEADYLALFNWPEVKA